MRARMFILPLVLVALLGAGPSAPDERDRARLLGALVHTRVTGRFIDTPARDALAELSRAAGVPLVGRFADDRVGHGLDPDIRVTLAFDDLGALAVLELLLEQCAVDEACTWQVRAGFVEVGTKRRLASPSAIERRSYPIRDLMVEPPYFASTSLPSVGAFRRHPYACAALTRPAPSGRKDAGTLALEIVEGIVEIIEPGNWDYGQIADAGERPSPRALRIGAIRPWSDQLIVRAPGFMHRRIGGEASVLVPPAAAPDRAAELLGVLTFTRLTVDFDAMPARDAIDEMRRRLGILIVGRYADDALGYGIDPVRPITLAVEDAPALGILEEILAQCADPGAPCTWQLRKGFVEVGTKARLSVPAARETRTHYIGDLIIDVPRFEPGGPFERHDRRRREVLALDVVQTVVETIEPGSWDYGQIDQEDDMGPRRPAPESIGAAAQVTPPVSTPAPPAPTAAHPTYVPPRKVAIIRYWRDILIVHAPDYVHRALGGYPEPIRP